MKESVKRVLFRTNLQNPMNKQQPKKQQKTNKKTYVVRVLDI